MNKAQLVDAIASKAQLSKTDAQNALNAFIDAASEALKSGDNVAISGFGTFAVSSRAARAGRNPQTGAAINIPAKKVAKFKAGTELSKRVSE